MDIPESMWEAVGSHLGYSEEELAAFRANPKNADILAHGPELMSKTIIMEVVASSNCNSLHKVGDRFYFDGAGNLLTKLSPKKICIYALQACATMIFTANELVYAGADPNDMRLNRAGCFDVGVRCGGWGRIVLECRVTDRESACQTGEESGS